MVELVYQTSVRLANLPQNLSRNREAEK
jgi:hypothetical protein